MNRVLSQVSTPAQAAMATSPAELVVVGLGYIGLPTAASFAASGLSVVGVDVNHQVVNAVNAGSAHIEEQGLEVIVARCVASGSLRATMTMEPADAFIIAVPTPVKHESRTPDIGYVKAAGEAIAQVLRPGNLVILESTCPVGTTQWLARQMSDLRPDLRFPLDGESNPNVHVAYCPERIIPGAMLAELVHNDRIIGGISTKCGEKARELYMKFVRGECLLTDDRTAELCKLVENSYRDVNIAFANELSMICGDTGLDAWKVISLANRHPRVNILSPGPGVGGHCIAVDPWFIVAGSPERAKLIRMAREVNDSKPEYVAQQVSRAVVSSEQPSPRIACLGLTYKPNVDDFRESPALSIARTLSLQYPGQVVCYDPYQNVLASSGEDISGIVLSSAEDALRNADIVVLLVGHEAFRGSCHHDGQILVDTVGFWH